MQDLIKDALERNVEEIVHSDELKKALLGPKKLRVYFGIDPTSPDIHLGHTIALRKLRTFQELGHKVILLFGDFTAAIGDPSGRDSLRAPLSKEKISENVKDYQDQAQKILDLKNSQNPVEVRFNSAWHGKESKSDLLAHGYFLTVSQLIERDLFARRIKAKQPISLTEFLYPYLQGYDAVKLRADLQIGGTDQLFNMLVGRELRRKMENKLQMVMTVKLIEGTDGRKMSKTYGNTINLTDSAKDIYGKIMSIKDDLMIPYFEALTNVSMEAIEIITHELKTKNPKEIKARLAFLITEELVGELEAQKARVNFEKVFAQKSIPEDIQDFNLGAKMKIIDLLVKTSLASSKSEAQRLIRQGGVKFNGNKIIKIETRISESGVLQVGKRKFINIKMN